MCCESMTLFFLPVVANTTNTGQDELRDFPTMKVVEKGLEPSQGMEEVAVKAGYKPAEVQSREHTTDSWLLPLLLVPGLNLALAWAHLSIPQLTLQTRTVCI